jgi:multidrug efflux pump
MLTATFVATFLIPMFYVVVSNRLVRKKPAEPAASAMAAADQSTGGH